MGLYSKQPDKKSGDGLALTEWNDLSNALAGNAGLSLAVNAIDKIGIGTVASDFKLEVNNTIKLTNNAKDKNDGVIGVATWRPGLNIVGINTDSSYRKISLWGQITQEQNDGKNTWAGNNIFNGNVGIGTNPSAEKLEVKGKVKATHFIGDGSGLTNLSVGLAGLNLATAKGAKVGIGNSDPNATLDVARGTAPWGTAVFRGTKRYSHFNYSVKEDTYIRGGKNTSNVYLNDTGGKVGIGMTKPDATLDVARGIAKSGTAVFRGTNRHSHFNYSTDEHTYIRGGKKASYVLINDNGGNVGIGTNKPAYPLHVVGYKAIPGQAAESWFNPNTDLKKNAKTSTSSASIFATNYIASAQGFVAHSDSRLKNINGKSKGVEDLRILTQIEVTNYTMRDQIENDQDFKKVIAQQVRSVYPQAVTQGDGNKYIANLYQLVANFKIERNIITMVLDKPIEEKDAQDIISGACIKFYLNEKTEASKMKEMEGTITTVNGNTITFKVAETLETDKYHQLFAYGTKVNDILSIDYDAISILNVSATQEIYRQLQQQKEEISELQLAHKDLRKEYNALRVQMDRPLAKV